MFSYFKNRKTTSFHVFCLNFSIETKIKTIFQISYFNLSKNEMVLWVHGFNLTYVLIYSLAKCILDDGFKDSCVCKIYRKISMTEFTVKEVKHVESPLF